ncbi:UPF0175 family protein [Endozoicomonas sp. 8E]|uniref:UPF0175 family protein n=1 Tax=Endozoicomonas sp. 8E TaxID=3035692 RepID=UPI0029394B42|nr:UPF0175 family protein [Endozoicomonas sp. 8E]WOG27206.1 UPF0175 family protein [Endozoicomonas sp. 8E]
MKTALETPDLNALLGIPFTDELLEQEVAINLAMHLFRNDLVTLTKGARITRVPLVDFIQMLGTQGIPVVDHDPADLDSDLENLG